MQDRTQASGDGPKGPGAVDCRYYSLIPNQALRSNSGTIPLIYVGPIRSSVHMAVPSFIIIIRSVLVVSASLVVLVVGRGRSQCGEIV